MEEWVKRQKTVSHFLSAKKTVTFNYECHGQNPISAEKKKKPRRTRISEFFVPLFCFNLFTS